MSLRIQATIICDGCGTSIVAEPEHRATHSSSTINDARALALAAGWLCVRRGRHTPAHYCSACADRPHPPVSRRRRRGVPVNLLIALSDSDF